MDIKALYFSPQKTTERIIKRIVERLNEMNQQKNVVEILDFTNHRMREDAMEINVDSRQLLIIGIPVYAGRVPNILLPFLSRLQGNGGHAIAIVNYGNRHFDDALSELVEILKQAGFNVVAAAAFVSEHAFSSKIAYQRPDERDMLYCDLFAEKAYRKLNEGSNRSVVVPGNVPPGPYYRPLDINGLPYDFRKIKPETSSDCIKCGICAVNCPMGTIDSEDFQRINGICIKCCVCVKACVVGAKHFKDPNFIKHKEELEKDCILRCKPTFYL